VAERVVLISNILHHRGGILRPGLDPAATPQETY
jgi:hypothetical protein